MPPVKCVWFVLGIGALCFQGLCPDTFGQGAVAFDPIIGSAPTGETMTVTPAVSADRRYVRLSVNPFFNTVNGFTAFNTPLGAVGGVGASGGGLGGGGLGGGLGGLGGGLGGVGGLRSVAGFGAGGETFNAGMNGVIGPAGFDRAMGYATSGFVGPDGAMQAGAFPYDGDFGYGTSLYPRVTTGFLGRNDVNTRTARQSRPAVAETARSEGSQSPGTPANTTATARRSVLKSVARREKARSAHAAKLKKASDEEPVIKPKATTAPSSAG
jgi:hypothetical protein